MKMVEAIAGKRCAGCGLVFAANLANFAPRAGGVPGILCRECARRLRRERRMTAQTTPVRTPVRATERIRARSSSESG